MIYFRKYLIPLNLVYRLIIFIRNQLYNHGFIKLKELNSKVISVGNISAGGTGKTPLTEHITEYLMNRDKYVAVICKGYKRRADDICVAEFGFKNENAELNSDNFGDEGLMLLENLSYINAGKGILVVSDNKTQAAKFAAAKFKPEVIILDDGFQHRKLVRDLDIVILNPKEGKKLLPSGNLREPMRSVKRCDIVVINNKFESTENIPNKIKFKTYVDAKYIFKGFYNYKNQNPEKDIKATAFCGIADPDSFKLLLTANKVEIDEFIVFPDHHNFTSDDTRTLLKKMATNKSTCLLTTQKDFVRFKYSSSETKRTFVKNSSVYYAKIKMELANNSQKFYEAIDRLIA